MACAFLCAPIYIIYFSTTPQSFCIFLRLAYNANQLVLLYVTFLPGYAKASVESKGFIFTFKTT